MKATDDGDGAFRYSRRAQPKKGEKDTPGDLCFYFGSGTCNAAKAFGTLVWDFLTKKEERKKRMTKWERHRRRGKGKKKFESRK